MPRQGSPKPDDRQPFLNSGALPFLIIGFVAAELYVFTLIAQRIGFIPAFLLAFVKAALGLALVSAFMRQLFAGMRRQGASIVSLSGSKLGTRVLVITDDRKDFGDALAEKLGRELWDLRYEVMPPFLSIDEALDKAIARNQGTVVIADAADNPGGGAACNTDAMGNPICGNGTLRCREGMLRCEGAVGRREICNCVDDDCDGMVDEDAPGENALCPGGGRCVSCQCLTPCLPGEFPCSVGLVCNAENLCVPPMCGTEVCRNDQICVNNRCVEQCETVTCPSGEVGCRVSV